MERRLSSISAEAMIKVEQGFEAQDNVRTNAASNASNSNGSGVVQDVNSGASASDLEGGGN